MRDKIQEILVQAVAGTKDLTESIDQLLVLYNVVQQSEQLFCQCGNKEVVNVCDDCLDKMVREGA